MKYSLIIFVFFLTVQGAFSQKCPQNSKYFIIDSVLKSTEHSGVYGGGSLVTYTVYFTVKKNKLRFFDSAWAFNNGATILLTVPKNTPERDLKFRKKKHFRLTIGIPYNHHPSADDVKQATVRKPLDCPQELILRYRTKKKWHYIALSDFKILPTINLP